MKNKYTEEIKNSRYHTFLEYKKLGMFEFTGKAYTINSVMDKGEFEKFVKDYHITEKQIKLINFEE